MEFRALESGGVWSSGPRASRGVEFGVLESREVLSSVPSRVEVCGVQALESQGVWCSGPRESGVWASGPKESRGVEFRPSRVKGCEFQALKSLGV